MPDRLLPNPIYEKYLKAKSSTETVPIIAPKNLDEGITTIDTLWHFVATEVSDFAFALSNRHCWDAVSMNIEGRSILINSVYPNDTSYDNSNHNRLQLKSMRLQSEDIPGIPYPYPVFTTFITGLGGGGMEYPMMANNAGYDENITIHEMFHTYFPMYVRINERRWAWMDEGWADYVTALTYISVFR